MDAASELQVISSEDDDPVVAHAPVGEEKNREMHYGYGYWRMRQ